MIEEELLEKIKFVLSCGNDAQAIRLIEQLIFYQEELASELAIDFASWCFSNTIYYDGLMLRTPLGDKYDEQEIYSYPELLEIYKKEKQSALLSPES